MEPLLTMYRLIFLNRHMVQKSKRAWELSCERFGFLSIQRYPIAPGFQWKLRKDGKKMDTKRTINVGLIGVLALLLFTGCAMTQGVAMLGAPESHGQRVTLQDLVKNWQDYTIYYAGQTPDIPAALLFDPKNDNKKLEGKWWERVKDKETLTSMVSFIKNYTNYSPHLYSIVGPGGVVYGYVFSPTNDVLVKVLNANTLYVYNVESPLYKGGGGEIDAGHGMSKH